MILYLRVQAYLPDPLLWTTMSDGRRHGEEDAVLVVLKDLQSFNLQKPRLESKLNKQRTKV
jgi:hypothetical protein